MYSPSPLLLRDALSDILVLYNNYLNYGAGFSIVIIA